MEALLDLEAARKELDSRRALAAHLCKAGLYDFSHERDSCGVGLFASLDGKPGRRVVTAGIEALQSVWHRGAIGSDGKTGDGAGIHLQIPQRFFQEQIARAGQRPGDGVFAVGMVFLPRSDLTSQERCRVIVEREILRAGWSVYGWRQVPIGVSVIGALADANRPEIEQIMIEGPRLADEFSVRESFERSLYRVRRRIERGVVAEGLQNFYICSLSCRSVIYKGMFLAEQLSRFYPDLQDSRFVSSFAIFHQRYSTNTFPNWWLAQPFRILAHNGEINTLRGNINWMRAHEACMSSSVLGLDLSDLRPVVSEGVSDSAGLDAVFELLLRSGRSLPMVKSLMIPEAWEENADLSEDVRGLYEHCSATMEPWDGPAAICATDGRWVLAGMDRNGLRPLRYAVSEEGLLFAGSEMGMVRLEEKSIIEKGRVGPGEMLALDLSTGKLYRDAEMKTHVASTHPFARWSSKIRRMRFADLHEKRALDSSRLRRLQVAAGVTLEDLELILHPMVKDAKEPTGSMGDDTPIAVLSNQYRGLHHFFRQDFSQVTNPPIDSLRERRVMTLRTRLESPHNILDDSPCRFFSLDSPVLTNASCGVLRRTFHSSLQDIDCTFAVSEREGGLSGGLERICAEAEAAARRKRKHIFLNDAGVCEERASIPMILAVSAVHIHLIRRGLRTLVSLHVRVAECLDVHQFAVLIGVGATTVNPWLTQESILDRHRRGLLPDFSVAEAVGRYRKAVDDGLRKILSKMGISVLSSYRGGYNFEALGLSRTLVDAYFPFMPSRISGIGLHGIARKVLHLHRRAFTSGVVSLPIGGIYRYRTSGETHGWAGELIHCLQSAVSRDAYSVYKKFSKGVGELAERNPTQLRDLLDFGQKERTSVALEEVESVTSLRKRFVTPGMSLGALSPEAHGTLNIAMNRVGARSVSGEGGEDPKRFRLMPNGDNADSSIKQVASGRFGVSAAYLNRCKEIEIKIAQGAKPGEGGQLPGFKVTDMIARLRHSTPGVTLISPPPHHDIYSIEDLAQLIYDLKQINPIARVCVKLVARAGIGAIAAGVAKASADVILVSGHSGGTGASPQSSIKYVGLPWEMGIAETHQVLCLNRLRDRVVLRTDGGLKTGRDIVIAAMLGAEEFGIGTMSLVAMGCIMVRQCHSNTCPVGVCTQRPSLRDKFVGTPERVVNLMGFLAEEVREILSCLGFRSLREAVGRSDLLQQVSRGVGDLDNLDLNPILVRADNGDRPACTCLRPGERNKVPETLDTQMILDARSLFEDGEKLHLQYNVRNTQRAVGAGLASEIVRRFGMDKLKPGHVSIRLRGAAGQSLGAFMVQGMRLELFGDANDYVGKGLSGGEIIIRPKISSRLSGLGHTILGNTVLYGAIGGRLFAAGSAGERFAVRNSGADAVVEGCGDNGCEYMTGGRVVILGRVGRNFAAGMSGGMAFVYDREDLLERRINTDFVLYQRLASTYWLQVLRSSIEEHKRWTSSLLAERLLLDWEQERRKFWQIVPKEFVAHLKHPLRDSVRRK